MRVLQLDQFHSCDPEILNMSLKDFQQNIEAKVLALQGEPAKVASVIFGAGCPRITDVKETDSPSIGDVWFREDEHTGKLVIWKAKYDTSD
jgi:hypothetical protein